MHGPAHQPAHHLAGRQHATALVHAARLYGSEGQPDAGELDADVVRAAVLDQPDLGAPPSRQLAQRAALRDLLMAAQWLKPQKFLV